MLWENVMKLIYSDGKKKIPLIIFENGSRLIFSATTETDKGFKYLAFNGRSTRTATLSGAKAKVKRTRKVSNHISFMVDTSIKRPGKNSLPKEAGKAGLSKITVAFLRKNFKLLIDDDGYFPRENLPTLEAILNKINGHISDKWDHDPTIDEEDDE